MIWITILLLCVNLIATIWLVKHIFGLNKTLIQYVYNTDKRISKIEKK